MTRAQEIGRYGEQIVYDILETAEWNNPFIESSLHYDMMWEGIKIEVKTSFQHSASSSIAYQFSSVNKGKDVVLVAVGLAETDNIPVFWVMPAWGHGLTLYAKIKDSISKENIKNAIKSIA